MRNSLKDPRKTAANNTLAIDGPGSSPECHEIPYSSVLTFHLYVKLCALPDISFANR